MLTKQTEIIFIHTSKDSTGRWIYSSGNAEYWFALAKAFNSLSHFTLASTLSAMEVWDIIGLEE